MMGESQRTVLSTIFHFPPGRTLLRLYKLAFDRDYVSRFHATALRAARSAKTAAEAPHRQRHRLRGVP